MDLAICDHGVRRIGHPQPCARAVWRANMPPVNSPTYFPYAFILLDDVNFPGDIVSDRPLAKIVLPSAYHYAFYLTLPVVGKFELLDNTGLGGGMVNAAAVCLIICSFELRDPDFMAHHFVESNLGRD